MAYPFRISAKLTKPCQRNSVQKLTQSYFRFWIFDHKIVSFKHHFVWLHSVICEFNVPRSRINCHWRRHVKIFNQVTALQAHIAVPSLFVYNRRRMNACCREVSTAMHASATKQQVFVSRVKNADFFFGEILSRLKDRHSYDQTRGGQRGRWMGPDVVTVDASGSLQWPSPFSCPCRKS